MRYSGKMVGDWDLRNSSIRNIYFCEVGLWIEILFLLILESGIEIYLRLSKYEVFLVIISLVVFFKIRSIMGVGVRDRGMNGRVVKWVLLNVLVIFILL